MGITNKDVLKTVAIDVPNLKTQLDNKANSYETKITGIKGWRQPNQNKKIVFIGDSTTELAVGIYQDINYYHTGSGDLLSNTTSDNIINKGSNGQKLENFIADEISPKGIKACVDQQADLYIFCYGINDVRLGDCSKDKLISMIDTVVKRLLKETNAYILLRTPNTLASDSPNGYIVPSNAGQQYTDLMWSAYEYFRNKYPRVDVFDTQTILYGRTSLPVLNNPYLADDLHPNSTYQARLGTEIAKFIGEKPSASWWKLNSARLGSNKFTPWVDYPKVLEDGTYRKVCEGYFVAMGNNYIDFAVPNEFISYIRKGDIIKIGDELAYTVNGTLLPQGANIRLLQTFTDYAKNNKGMVTIYRQDNKAQLSFTVRNSGLPKIVGSFIVDKPCLVKDLICSLDTTYTSDTFNVRLLLKNNNNPPLEMVTMFSVNGDKGFRGLTWNTTNFPNSMANCQVGDFIIVECTSRTGTTQDVGMGFILS